MADENVVVKKVSPYPIPVQISGVGAPVEGRIVKLTERGYLVSMASMSLIIGKAYEVNFRIPASSVTIIASAKVIKTYDRKIHSSGSPSEAGAAPPANSPQALTDQQKLKEFKSERLVEMHFSRLSDEQKDAINKFTTAIGQKD